MDNELEINFIQNQLNANSQMSAMIQHQIATLLGLVHQDRQWVEQIEKSNAELNFRLNSINQKNKILVKHYE